MFSSADKVNKSSAIRQQPAGATFFRKAGEDSFFGAKENPSFLKAPIQAKLKVSTPDDPEEKEADQVAEKVMRTPDTITASAVNDKKEEKVQTKPSNNPRPIIQRKISLGKSLQAKGDNQINTSLYHSDILRQSGRAPPAGSIPFEQTLASSKGGGSALPGDTQQFMESRFNADFSGVRVHTGSTAVQLSSSIQAKAFAHGNDIYFNSGQFSPNSSHGGSLLAHELTHTIQQGASKPNAEPAISRTTIPQKGISRKEQATSHYDVKHVPKLALKSIGVAGGKNISRSEEIKKVDASPSFKNIIQPKPALSNMSVGNNGSLNSKPIVAKSLPVKLSAKEAEKKEEENNSGYLGTQVIERKQESLIHQRDNGIFNDAPSILSTFKVQLQNEYTSESDSLYSGSQPGQSLVTQDRGPPHIVSCKEAKIQRSVVDDAMAYAGSVTDCIFITSLESSISCVKQKAQQVAMHIPGYKALRVVLGTDPITGEGVAQNGRSFIEAAFDIIPGGELLHRKLDEIHKLDAAAQWIDEKIGAVKGLVNGISGEISRFWSSLNLGDVKSPLEVLKRGANIVLGFIGNVVDFAKKSALDFLKMVKDILLDKIVDFIKNETTAYPLLTVILGQDPITEKRVEKNGTTILNALLELGGEEGRQQKKKMDETGTFKKAAGYIDEGITIFSGAYTDLVAAFTGLWSEVTIQNLMDPIGTFKRIYNNFATPIEKVWDFIKKVGAEILKFVKEVMMKELSAWAKTVRGYPLVTVIIGQDPFTKEAVPPTVENLIHGFMSLMDGGEEQFKQMKESGAVAKAEMKIKAAVKKLNMTPQYVIQLFTDLWNSLSIKDLLDPVGTFKRVLEKFGEPIGRLIAFVVEIVKIVVEVILIIMQFPFDLINNIMAKAMQAFEKIKADPIGFLKNLLRAIKEGFIQFFDNILKHLLAGLVGWLTSELKDAGVKAPKDFSLASIIGWVLELLGITMEKIWDKLAKHPRIGPAKVAKIRGMINTLEGIWTFIKDVQERGMAAIWDKIVEKLSNLWDTVLDSIKNWIMDQIVTKIVTKLLSMLDPTGIMAVVNSAIALYKALESFKKYMLQILQIVNSFVEGLVEIASGNTKKAANFLESTLARGVPVVIGFLANQVGLSGVGKKVGEMIEKVREIVDKALTWLVNKAVDTGMNLLDKVMDMGKNALDKAKDVLFSLLGIKKQFKGSDGETHTLSFRGEGDKAKLIVASVPTEVEVYLSQKKSEANRPEIPPAVKSEKLATIATAESIYTANIKIIYEHKPPSRSDKDQRVLVMQKLDQISDAFAKLAGDFDGVYPDVVDTPGSSKPSMKKIEKISKTKVVKGPKPPDSDKSSTHKWDFIVSNKLQRQSRGSDKWVQMHLIDRSYGGMNGPDNLIPAPNSVNRGHFNSFETGVSKLIKGSTTGPRPINNVVWAETHVVYNGEFASGIFGTAGLYHYMGKMNGENNWKKAEQPVVEASDTIRSPLLDISGLKNLNMVSKTQLQGMSVFNIPNVDFAKIIAENRRYKDQDDFRNKIGPILLGRGVANHANILNSVLNHDDVIVS